MLAVLAIVVVRPASMLLSLMKTGMPRAEKLTAAWFGPKGFASVVYGLLVLQADIPNGEKLFDAFVTPDIGYLVWNYLRNRDRKLLYVAEVKVRVPPR